MAQFNNTMGISELWAPITDENADYLVKGNYLIAFTHTVQCVCAIGKSLCTYDMVVEMVPGKVIPDYLEVQEFMDNEVHMHFLTMEDATAAVANYLDLNYLPVSGTVSCLCDDARHFPVRVTKRIGGNE